MTADALRGMPDDERARDDLRSEAFIPYEQIEPLLAECADADELKWRLCALTGLDPKVYRFVTRMFTFDGQYLPLAEALKHGLYVERFDSPDPKCAAYVPGRGEPLR